MKNLFELFGYGYGVFSTNGGEHLNKRIKHYELNETNLDNLRFQTVIRLIRTKQFHFSSCVMKAHREMTCSRCNQPGHYRSNKSCPMHPSHPDTGFDSSDSEGEEEN